MSKSEIRIELLQPCLLPPQRELPAVKVSNTVWKNMNYLQARFSACIHSNSLSIWTNSDHNRERTSEGRELSRSCSYPSCRILSEPILFGERVRLIESRLGLILMLPACCLLISWEQVDKSTIQIYSFRKKGRVLNSDQFYQSVPLTRQSESSLWSPAPGGALGYFLGGYVLPGTPNWHPVLKTISPKIDTPF